MGWHYVVDGYFSIIAVPVIWWVAGKFSFADMVKRVEPHNEPPVHEPLTP